MNTFVQENEAATRKWKRAHQLPKCATCKWWLPVWYGGRGPYLEEGVCKRFPHVPRCRGPRYRTKPDDWCGEHTPDSP